MDYLDKLGETVAAKGRVAADRAKDVAEVVKLKRQIATCEEVMKKNYLEIGKLYFEQYGNAPDALFEKQCRAIANARNGVNELRKKVDEKKGL